MIVLPLAFIAALPTLCFHEATAPNAARVQCVEVIAGELASALGRPVTVNRNLKRHVIFFDRREDDAESALKSIATAIHATLLLDKNGFRITRTSGDLKTLRSNRQAVRAQWLRDKTSAVKKFRSRTLAGPSLSSDFVVELNAEAKRQAEFFAGKSDRVGGFFATELLPPESLLEGLIERIGVEKIAAIPSGTTEVFEDQPIDGAKAMPPHEDLLDAYVARCRKTGKLDLEPNLSMSLAQNVLGKFISYADDETVKSDRLRLQCRCLVNQLILTLEGFDATGRRNLFAALGAGPVLEHRTPATLLREAIGSSEPDFVDLSEESVAALKDTKAVDEAGSDRGSTAPAWVKDPVKNEPLDLWVRDAIYGLTAPEQAKCVVCDVSDLLWANVESCIDAKGKISLAAARAAMIEWNPYEKITSDGVFILRPIDPEFDEESHADRAQLKAFAYRNTPLRFCDIHAIGKFVHAVSDTESGFPFRWVKECDLNNNITVDLRRLPWSYFNFIGSISDDRWEDLRAGSVLTAGSLGVREALRQMLTDDELPGIAGQSAFPDINKHPIELFSRTNIDDVPISVRPFSEQEYRFIRPGQGSALGWGRYDQLWSQVRIPSVSVRFVGDRPILPVTREQFEAKSGPMALQVGESVGVEITIGLPFGFSSKRKLAEGFSFSEAPVQYSSLPSAMRDEIWDRVSSAAVRGALETRKHERQGQQINTSTKTVIDLGSSR